MKKMMRSVLAASIAMCAALQSSAGERVLTLDEYRDKMKAGWVGQMVGVSWGLPTEFRFNDKMIPADKVPAYTSDMLLKWAYGNDDLYVEMTFLKTLEDYGLDVSMRRAGIDFANSEYQLWCANLAGRTNLRRGIAPPDSSHPAYNKCPNDIDYQIEADYSGLIAPGCPQEVIHLGNIFGRLMNYGDGVWAGQFIGALYSEAFFTTDVDKLLDSALAAIPGESEYAQMVRNVRAWHRESPNDWTECWEKILAKYSKRKNPAMKDSNGGIDARVNGAAVVLGLLYGKGDVDKAMELSMRCGWDSDCNPSSVGGILMTMCGFKSLPAKYTEKLNYTTKFSYTAYDLPGLFAVCEKLARQVVVRRGGRIEKDANGVERFVIPDSKPVPDAFVPSWKAGKPEGVRYTDEEIKEIRHAIKLPHPEEVASDDPTVRVQKTLDVMWPGWKTSENGSDMNPGLVPLLLATDVNHPRGVEMTGLLRTHPPKRGEPVVLSRSLKVAAGNPMLHFEASNSSGGDFLLIVRVNGCDVLKTVLDTIERKHNKPHMRTFDISLEPWVGREVKIELINQPTGWMNEAAIWRNIRITANSAN